jgi:mannose-6-phosphate isomerase
MKPTHHYLSERRQPLLVEGQIQGYAWGKVGRASRIAPFMHGAPPESPLAEYWLGCHPKAPAVVLLPDGSRCSLIDLLPSHSSLPFMLKVLSINPAFGLSIQSHPDAELAKELHARDPEHYPDPFHKPEVGVALSPVTLLYDIKSPTGLCEAIRNYPEIMELLSDNTRRVIEASNGGLNGPSSQIRRGMFGDCMMADSGAVAQVVTEILARHDTSRRDALPKELVMMERLTKAYGVGDVGLVVLLLMNLVSLDPGEGIFIGPNVPHAYLDGDLVECMASSDNVIRAGLTSKYRDVSTLVETTVYDYSGEPQRAKVRELSPYLKEFVLPVKEFRLMVIRSGADSVQPDLSTGHALALCLGTQAVISFGAGSGSLTLSDGEAALLPQGAEVVKVSTDSAQVFIAQSGEFVSKKGFEYEG